MLEIRDLCRRYPGNDQAAVDHIQLELPMHQLTVILGPSGCGKTTLLRMIAGLETPDSGKVFLDGRDLSAAPPEKRNIGMVFQEDSLFPTMSLRQQIAWAASCKPGDESVNRLLDLGGMTPLANRRPHQLSGGERQRGAVLRSLAANPEVLLFDEPFSRLDAPLRDVLRRDIKKLLKATNTTAVLVTHDQEEALSLADYLVLMNKGRIIQTGTPEQIYEEPQTAFAARFLGRANIFEATADGNQAILPWGPVALQEPATGPVSVMLRPEHLGLTSTGPFLVKSREFRGHDVTWRLDFEGREIIAHTDWGACFEEGQTVGLEVRKPAIVLQEI